MILLAALSWWPCQVYAAKNILVYGDSLSAGYRIAVEQSWPFLLQQELAARHPDYRVVNVSISGETAGGGLARSAAVLQQHRPALVIVELGANDGLRGLGVAQIEDTLAKLIVAIQQSGASVLLAGMKLPPNYGEAYTAQFEQVYQRLSRKYRIVLLPFLLEGVSPEQFQADNLHPLASAQPQIMRNVIKKLKPLLR